MRRERRQEKGVVDRLLAEALAAEDMLGKALSLN